MYRSALILGTICLFTDKAYTDTNYRLNTPITPVSYSIAITPYFDTNDVLNFTFYGQVQIVFTTETVTNQIQLHSEGLYFSASNVSLWYLGEQISLNATNPLEFDTNYTFVYINVGSDMQVGVEYSLFIEYVGPIRGDLNGFYRNYYKENGVKKWLGATQMEPTHARKVFPCLDEPQLKATFRLTIDRPAHFKPSLANTKLLSTTSLPNGLIREIFYPTPKMSTYLVAFLVSEFEAREIVNNNSRAFGVYTRPQAINQTSYAYDFGQRVVNALGDYLRIDYYSVDSNLKLDHIALPNFRAGAMENWGLIKYRESLLLYVPEESTPHYKYKVAQIIAHETTHMWFGNLVTCHWWSNTWLNEGFANYFQDYITALIEPEVGSADILVTGSVYEAYSADESSLAPAITNDNVNSPAEISGHFGIITYQKAGSVIRMVHHLIGDEAFRDGLNAYLTENMFDVGYPDRLYSSLQKGINTYNSLSDYPGFYISDILSTWVVQAGHPIVHATVNDDDTVTLTQKRFNTQSGAHSNEIYNIPITYTTESSPDFNNTKPAFIMENRTHTFTIANISDEHGWILFNIQETGFYRVNYDDHTWHHISNALNGSQRENIHYLNRAKIVNDLFAFLYADEVKFSLLYDVFEFLTDETDYSVWYAAIRGFNKLRNVYFGTEVQSEIDKYALRLLDNIIYTLGYEVNSTDDFITLRNRMQILEFSCKIGHRGCIDYSVGLFKGLKENQTEIPPSLRPVAYCNGLRHGDDDDYDFLWRRMSTTNIANEARLIGEVLGCTKEEDKLKSYLVSMLQEDSPIMYQDLTMPLTSVLSDFNNARLVIEELEENYALWSTIYPSMDLILSTVASALHTQEEFDQFESFLSSCSGCSQQVKNAATSALNNAKQQTVWAENHKTDILHSLKNNAIIATPSLFTLAVCAVVTILFKF